MFNVQNTTFCAHNVFVYLVCISEKKQPLFPHAALAEWLT